MTSVSRPSKKHSGDNVEFFSETLQHIISFDLDIPKTADEIRIAVVYVNDEGVITQYPQVGFTGKAKGYEYLIR